LDNAIKLNNNNDEDRGKRIDIFSKVCKNFNKDSQDRLNALEQANTVCKAHYEENKAGIDSLKKRIEGLDQANTICKGNHKDNQ